MDKRTRTEAQGSTAAKAQVDWTSLNQPMTDGQRWHLRFLAAEAGEVMDENLTKAEAAKRISDLQAKTRRGKKKPSTGGLGLPVADRVENQGDIKQ